jgi:hypothetical protein
MKNFTSIGRVEVRNGIRIVTSLDFIRYYTALVVYSTYRTKKFQLPAHGAHITILNPKIHKEVDFNRASKYHNLTVEFTYSPENVYISRVNYWMPVKCKFGNQLKHELGIVDGPNWLGFHLTICNVKFNVEQK